MAPQSISDRGSNMAFSNQEAAQSYWKANIRLVLRLLAVWALVSYGFGILLAEPLNAIQIGGFKLGFWFAQQGSIYVFVCLIFVYVWQMKKIDDAFGVREE